MHQTTEISMEIDEQLKGILEKQLLSSFYIPKANHTFLKRYFILALHPAAAFIRIVKDEDNVLYTLKDSRVYYVHFTKDSNWEQLCLLSTSATADKYKAVLSMRMSIFSELKPIALVKIVPNRDRSYKE